MVRVGILGIAGRMGQAIAEALRETEAIPAGGVARGDDPAVLATASDVLIDFSTPDALAAHLAVARHHGVALVIGTTGLTPAHHAAIDDAARDIPILQAANTALGVALLAQLVREAASRLGPDWDIEIIETHHRHKRDAPSGTALLLAQSAADGRGVALADALDDPRAGFGPPRASGTIGIASLRGGSVAGDHQVIFAGAGERIELGHRAEDRMIFARGAVRAALWLAGRPSGRYGMGDVLGL